MRDPLQSDSLLMLLRVNDTSVLSLKYCAEVHLTSLRYSTHKKFNVLFLTRLSSLALSPKRRYLKIYKPSTHLVVYNRTPILIPSPIF